MEVQIGVPVLSADIPVKGDELKREDLAKIKNQFNR
jgi:hypothetical protein